MVPDSCKQKHCCDHFSADVSRSNPLQSYQTHYRTNQICIRAGTESVPEEVQTRAVEIARAAKTLVKGDAATVYAAPKSGYGTSVRGGFRALRKRVGIHPRVGTAFCLGAVIQMAAGDDTSCGAGVVG